MRRRRGERAAPVRSFRRIGSQEADDFLARAAVKKGYLSSFIIEHNHGAGVSKFTGVFHISLVYPADQDLPRLLAYIQSEPQPGAILHQPPKFPAHARPPGIRLRRPRALMPPLYLPWTAISRRCAAARCLLSQTRIAISTSPSLSAAS